MNKIEEINLKLLELKYESYISRSHSVFEASISLVPTIILGIFGIFFTLLQVKVILFNKYYLTIFSLPTILLVISVSTLAIGVIANCRKHKNNIEKNMKNIRDNNINLKIS